MRKAILGLSVFFALLLFADGVAAISYMKELNRERIESKHKLQMNSSDSNKNTTLGTEPSPFNTLIIGYDEEGSRSDVILLLNISPASGKINILSIARDTRIVYKGRYEKLNALTAISGKDRLIEEVQKITGLPVSYYIALNFKGFRQIIDSLDGVQFTIPFDMDYDDPYQNLHVHLNQGPQLLNGRKSEQFVRYRKGNEEGQGYTDGDIGRIKAQQEFVKSFIEQKLKLKYISKAPEIFSILKKNMKTNIEFADVDYYLKYLKNIRYDDLKSFVIPGESTYEDDLWYFIYDRKKTDSMIEDNFFK